VKPRDPPDLAALVEEVIVSMIERRSTHPGDTADLIVPDLSLRLGLSARAIADPAPTRETLRGRTDRSGKAP
jgi:hypothetical protein